MLATAPADRPGNCEVKWMVGGNGGAPAVRASGWRGPQCGFTDAEGRKGEMIIGDQGSTDPGGGVGGSKRRPPSWI